MSAEDRRKWDARYRQGAYETRNHPSAFLEQCADRLPRRGRALDLACGAGRNAIFLAQRGLEVDAVDISSVALKRARKSAADLPINWLEADLEDGFSPTCGYDVIVNIRYVQLDLVCALVPVLRPGGVLVVEQHLLSDEAVTGPKNPAFRVAPGALPSIATDLDIEQQEEGVFVEPDGTVAALARLLARQPDSVGRVRPPTAGA